MQLKACSIDVKADMFTARTFIVMEFYNPNDKEIEGLYRFELKPGQAITAFQLDLFGKYRDGSIEEKWKATNAYNTIVGKRIDPALLTMESPDHYSLRIYPVPGKGSRKITMTIQQLLKTENNHLQYFLPLNVQDVVEQFSISIGVESGNNIPVTKPGLIAAHTFGASGHRHSLLWKTSKIQLKNPVAFAIPLAGTQTFCAKQNGVQTHFALRFKPSVPVNYAIQPNKITVLWDASASSAKRDINKEISFLRQFISYHNISQLTLVSFNHKLVDKVIFDKPNSSGSRWQQYIQNLEHKGATQLGAIDLSAMTADIFLLFTDGNNTYGKSKPKTGTALVYAVHASTGANATILNEIVGANGGKLVDLTKTTISEAIQINSRAENWLLALRSASGKVIVEQSFPQRVNEPLLINGTMPQGQDTLYFHYGNNNTITKTEKIVISSDKECSSSSVDRISMLDKFEHMIRMSNWETIPDFGLNEKIVTPNTAYIVLERIEDYVKYNITPPNELKEECEKMGWVKRDTRPQRQQARQADEFTILNGVVNTFNNRLYKWDSNEKLISLSKVEYDRDKLAREEAVAANQNAMVATSPGLVNSLSGAVSGLNFNGNHSLDEVVVTAYGSARKRSVTGSVAYIQSEEILPNLTVEQALQGRVAGLQVTNSFGQPGSVADIRIRGSSSLNGNSEPLFVLDGIPVSGNINDVISTSDIDNITVLKDASASAIYGSRGANGVIVINSKKGKQQYRYNDKPYRLKNMEDVEYLQQIKKAGKDEKIFVYEELRQRYADEPGFHLDIAQHFFETGMKQEAGEILMTAIEVSNGSFQVLRAVGYILEHWKQFSDAIVIYEQLRDDYPDNLYAHRDLAWAYYQDCQYQQAMETLFAAIKRDMKQQEWINLSLKSMMMAEMNAIISLHTNELDVSAIPTALIRATPADLRIVMDCNKGNLGNISIKEPGGEYSTYGKPVTKNGGMLMTNNSYSYYNIPAEYQIKNAVNGKYRIGLNYYDYYSYPGKIPAYIRIMTFRNFGRKNQSIAIENVVMDNQYGEVEIAEIKW